MKKSYKIIRDSIHGDIKLEGIFRDLLDCPELQRLSSIKQLGLAHLVFPGAHHTRFEHSLGTYHIALRIADVLELDPGISELFCAASILHDIGHGPFSHTLESILREKYDVDHVDLTEKLIFGEYDIVQKKETTSIDSIPRVHTILEEANLDKHKIVYGGRCNYRF